MNVGSLSATPLSPATLAAGRLGRSTDQPPPTPEQVAKASELRDAFGKFVGSTVFGQMMSSMRSTVGKPAYFHGGQTEEVFQSQLDQAIAEEMTTAGSSSLARSLFEHQFPRQAEVLRQAEGAPLSFDDLAALPSR